MSRLPKTTDFDDVIIQVNGHNEIIPERVADAFADFRMTPIQYCLIGRPAGNRTVVECCAAGMVAILAGAKIGELQKTLDEIFLDLYLCGLTRGFDGIGIGYPAEPVHVAGHKDGRQVALFLGVPWIPKKTPVPA